MEHEKFILPLHLGSLESLRIPGCRDLFVISRRVRECPEHLAALPGAGPHLRGCPPPHVPDLPGSGQLFHVLPLLRAGRQSQLPGGGLRVLSPTQYPKAHLAVAPTCLGRDALRATRIPQTPLRARRQGQAQWAPGASSTRGTGSSSSGGDLEPHTLLRPSRSETTPSTTSSRPGPSTRPGTIQKP